MFLPESQTMPFYDLIIHHMSSRMKTPTYTLVGNIKIKDKVFGTSNCHIVDPHVGVVTCIRYIFSLEIYDDLVSLLAFVWSLA